MELSSLKKNYIYNVFYQLLIIVVPLITSPYLSRVIGADGIGEYQFTQSFAYYFVIFIMLGIDNYGNREIAKSRDNKLLLNKTFSEIVSLQLTACVIVSFVYLLSLFFFIKGESRLLYLLQFFYVLSAGFDINWCCFGLEKFKLTVTRNSFIKVISTALVFLLVKDEDDVWIYTFIISFSTLISQIIVWPFILESVSFSLPNVHCVVSRIKPNLMLFLPVLSVSLYTVMDKLMLGILITKKEVAFYSYAERIVMIPISLISALGTVLLPRASNLAAHNDTCTRSKLLDRSMQFAMFLSAACTIGIVVISPQFIPWYYGDGFERCSLFAVFLSPIIIFTSWNTIIRTQIVLPEKKDKEYLYAVFSGAIINLFMNAVLIPNYKGLGAVFATLLAQLTVCIVQYCTVKNEVQISKYIRDLFFFIFFGLVMGLCMKVVPVISQVEIIDIIIRVIIGGLVYMVFVFGYTLIVLRDNSIISIISRLFKREKTI